MPAWRPALAGFTVLGSEMGGIAWPATAFEQSFYKILVHKLAVFILTCEPLPAMTVEA